MNAITDVVFKFSQRADRKGYFKGRPIAVLSFAPKAYTGIVASSGDYSIQVTGVFTLLGTSHDLTISMQIHIDGSKEIIKGRFVVPYVQWGLKNPSFLIGKAEIALRSNLA